MTMYGDFWPAYVDHHYRIHLFILNYNILSCQVQTCQYIFLAAISKSRHIHNLPVQCEKVGLRIQNEATLDTKEDGYQGEAEPEEANRGCPHLGHISLEEHLETECGPALVYIWSLCVHHTFACPVNQLSLPVF